MGNEIGQYIEWRYFEGIEYHLVNDFETHAKRKAYVEALNKFYLEYPALWQRAYESGGFEWIDCDNAEQNVICFIRHGFLPSDDLACVINFQPEAYEDYRIGVPKAGFWREVFNSDEVEFGGSGVTNGGMRFKASKPALHGFDYSINFRLPPLGGIVFAYDGMRRI
jgi:1,4-alpha-glucan branching enzyme